MVSSYEHSLISRDNTHNLVNRDIILLYIEVEFRTINITLIYLKE